MEQDQVKEHLHKLNNHKPVASDLTQLWVSSELADVTERSHSISEMIRVGSQGLKETHTDFPLPFFNYF